MKKTKPEIKKNTENLSKPKPMMMKIKAYSQSLGSAIKNNSENLSRVLAVIILFFALVIFSPSFAGVTNLLNILRVASLNLILATGIALCMLVSGIDLSVGSVIALSTMIFARYFQEGRTTIEMVFGIAGILAVSALIGAVNGVSIAYFGLPPFLATFGISQIIRGYSFFLSKGMVFAKFNEQFHFIGGGYVFDVPMPVILAGIMLIMVGLMLNKTTFGRKIYAVGSNKDAAWYSGINVKLTLVAVYALSAMIAGFGGIAYLSRLNTAEANIGLNFAQNAIAAAAIGGISFRGGRGNVFGIIVGALMLTLVTNGMNLLGIDSDWQMAITGAIIIISVLLDQSYVMKKV
jgi:ribose transport system permease protein